MPDCIIVGGGVIGLLTARELHRSGLDVLIVERGKLGGESTWAGGGIVSPLYPWRYDDAVNVLAEKSKRIYPELCAVLLEETGVDCELQHSGLLITHDEELQQAQRWAEQYGVSLQHITTARSLQEIEPQINPRFDRGIWLADVDQVRNPKLVEALRKSCDVDGISYREHSEVQQLLIETGRVRGIQIDGSNIMADRVVIASGAWSARVCAEVADIDVAPVKGQMIMLKTEAGLLDTIVMSQGHYVIPRRDGYVLTGSTLERTGFDKTLSSQARDELLQYASELVPCLTDYAIERHWSGLRPGTSKGIPYVCEHDEIANLYIHAGHYRNGIVLGAASARLMAEIILQKTLSCHADAYKMTSPH